MDNHAQDHRRTVFYDDACEMCEKAATKIRADIDLDTVGISGELPDVIDKKELTEEVHAMDEEGNVYKGIDAVIMIMRWHPWWRWFAPLVALPGVRHAAAAVYRFVAHHRHLFFGKRGM
jgi:predicted DCC family thiol-disulfide oxidoreductase YuxK